MNPAAPPGSPEPPDSPELPGPPKPFGLTDAPDDAGVRVPRARVVLVAAGSSTRMQQAGCATERKPWRDLGGRPVLEVCCAAVCAAPEVSELVIVAHPDDLERIQELAQQKPAFSKLVAVVAGGAERMDSVRQGVRASATPVDVIAIHDAARPHVQPETVSRAIRVAFAEGAALVAMPLTDTIKESTDGIHAHRTLDRTRLWAAQTPQCFRAKQFLDLLERAQREGLSPTDDAALWERWIGPVALVKGSPLNRKITTPEDLEIARALLTARNHGPAT